tara:strand:- start:17 stop:208 length:192 start_codon:yes stop_codon:yes gene_type:complete
MNFLNLRAVFLDILIENNLLPIFTGISTLSKYNKEFGGAGIFLKIMLLLVYISLIIDDKNSEQ